MMPDPSAAFLPAIRPVLSLANVMKWVKNGNGTTRADLTGNKVPELLSAIFIPLRKALSCLFFRFIRPCNDATKLPDIRIT